MYLELWQTSKMELLAKIVKDWKLAFFVKPCTLDVCQVSEYLSEFELYNLKVLVFSSPLYLMTVNEFSYFIQYIVDSLRKSLTLSTCRLKQLRLILIIIALFLFPVLGSITIQKNRNFSVWQKGEDLKLPDSVWCYFWPETKMVWVLVTGTF